MNVANIMTKEVITVNSETSLKEAAGLLAKFRLHGLPVIDENSKVLGIVTESDFFTKDASNIFLPTFLEFIGKKGADEGVDSDTFGIASKTKVSDIMTMDCFMVQPDLSVEELIQHFKEKNFNSMPVVNEQGVLVGIVSIMDVIKLL